MAKVLLIDDDQALVAVFESALTQEGFQVVVAYDGRTGIERATSEKPNLVLLDQVIPDMAGNDVLRALKQDNNTKSIPVAMLSNFGQNQLVQDALSQGAVDYILKYQVEPQDLVHKVKELLKETQTATVPQQ